MSVVVKQLYQCVWVTQIPTSLQLILMIIYHYKVPLNFLLPSVEERVLNNLGIDSENE